MSWGRRTGNNTLASREEEGPVAPPPLVWTKVETKRRDRGKNKKKEKGADNGEEQDAPGYTMEMESHRTLGTHTTNALSSKEARPREVL
jgi:hypothetical protein